MIHGSSDQLVKNYSGTLLYQYDITKFLGSWHFWFGRKKIYKFSAKYPLKTINTFLVSVKMHAKVIPTNGKHILNSPVGYITKLEKKNWDHVGASRYADFNSMMHSALVQLQGRLPHSANKIPTIKLFKLFKMKELKALHQI